MYHWKDFSFLNDEIRVLSKMFQHDKKIYLVGGSDYDEYFNDVHTCSNNLNTLKWNKLKIKEGPMERDFYTSVLYKDYLYVFGGCYLTNNHTFGDFWRLNLIELKWEKLNDVNGPIDRCAHGMVAFDDKLYVFGGYSNEKLLNDFYEYNIEQNEWRKIEESYNTPTKRSDFAYGVLNSRFFIFGGWKNINISHDAHNDAFYYDFYLKRWKKLIISLPVMKSGILFTIDNTLYLCGGYVNFQLSNKIIQISFKDDDNVKMKEIATNYVGLYFSWFLNERKLYRYGGYKDPGFKMIEFPLENIFKISQHFQDVIIYNLKN